MLRIRRVEEAIAEAYHAQQMRCPIHLSIGQEAVPVAFCAHLSHDDRIYSTHRCHAHYLAKDGKLPEMVAELYGKEGGCCRGKGGSMHLVQKHSGMMGASALVAGTIPLAVGSALAIKQQQKPFVAVAFFGDGASEEGIFYESLNFAALKRLPVIFACENNSYATYSHQTSRQATDLIFRRGESFGIPSARVDGNNVEAIFEAAQEAIARARSGDGPTLLECTTYRWRDHVGPNSDFDVGYRTKDEIDTWMERCPIALAERKLIEQGAMTQKEKDTLEAALQAEIAEAFAFAKSSPFPTTDEIFNHLYAKNQI